MVVYVIDRIFNGARREITLDVGASYRAAVVEAFGAQCDPSGVRVVSCDRIIPPERWDLPIPEEIPTVLRRIPENLKGVATWFLAPFFFTTLVLWKGIELLIPKLPNIRQPTQGVDSPTIAGVGNAILRYEPIWRLYGEMRLAFPYAAKFYRRTFKGEQYFYGLFDCGYGPLDFDLASFKIGDTALSTFRDVSVQIDEGEGTIWDVNLGAATKTVTTSGMDVFTTESDEEEVGFQYPIAGVSTDQAFVLPQPWTDAPTRTTVGDVRFIEIDCEFPQGLQVLTDKGHSHPIGMNFEIRIRKAAVGGPPGNWFGPQIDTRVFGTTDELRVTVYPDRTDLRWETTKVARFLSGFEIDAGEIAQWDVQMRKIYDEPGSGSHLGLMIWTVLRSMRSSQAVLKDGIALIALRIKASDQLNGPLSRFSVIARSKHPKYIGGAWTAPQITSNPAWIYADILKGTAVRRPVTDDRIDLPRLQEFAQYCEPIGYAWRFDGVFDYSTTQSDAVFRVLAAARSTYMNRDGKHSVLMDTPREKTGLVTGRNSRGSDGSFSFYDPPDGLRVRFQNADADWEEDERVVYSPGKDATNARIFEDADFPGVTHADQIWKLADYRVREAALRTGRYVRTMDWEYLGFERGDRVPLVDDVLIGEVQPALIRNLTFDSFTGAVEQVIIDTQIEYVPGVSYGMVARSVSPAAEITSKAYAILNPATTEPVKSFIITPDPEIPAFGIEPVLSVGDLLSVSELGQEFVDAMVLSIEPGPDTSAVVTFTEYAEGVFNIGAPIPPFTTSIRQSRWSRPPPPILGEPYEANGLIFVPVSIVSQSPSQVDAVWLQVQARALGGAWVALRDQPAMSTVISIDWLTVGTSYEIRVRTDSGLGSYSDWVSAVHDLTTSPDIDALDYRIVGLGLANSVEPAVFRGRDARFTWRLAHADGRETLSQIGEAANLLGAGRLQYVCQVRDLQSDQLVREEVTQTPGFTYSIAMQYDDPGPLRREFVFRVAFRDVNLHTSPWSTMVVSNPAPPMMVPTLTPVLRGFKIENDSPILDPDFVGIVIWAKEAISGPGTVIPVSLIQANEVFRGASIPLIAVLPYGNGWVRIAAFDEFAFNPATGAVDPDALNVTDEIYVESGSGLIDTGDIEPGAVTDVAEAIGLLADGWEMPPASSPQNGYVIVDDTDLLDVTVNATGGVAVQVYAELLTEGYMDGQIELEILVNGVKTQAYQFYSASHLEGGFPSYVGGTFRRFFIEHVSHPSPGAVTYTLHVQKGAGSAHGYEAFLIARQVKR